MSNFDFRDPEEWKQLIFVLLLIGGIFLLSWLTD